MTILEDFISKLILRRPPLLRWTPLKGVLSVYAELLNIYYTKFKSFRIYFWETFGSTIKKINPFFNKLFLIKTIFLCLFSLFV